MRIVNKSSGRPPRNHRNSQPTITSKQASKHSTRQPAIKPTNNPSIQKLNSPPPPTQGKHSDSHLSIQSAIERARQGAKKQEARKASNASQWREEYYNQNIDAWLGGGTSSRHREGNTAHPHPHNYLAFSWLRWPSRGGLSCSREIRREGGDVKG